MNTLSACAPAEPDDAEDAVDEALHVLRRASLDLRGAGPSEAEIMAIEADPGSLDTLLDTLVADERFPERLIDLYNPVYRTRSESMNINVGPLGISANEPFYLTVGEEPLRLLAQIAAEDLPYTEIVRADWSMVNETLAAYYPVDYPQGGSGWQKVHYTDGRPAAGILGTNGLWWRYTSTDSNLNRGRANAITRILLCQDYLKRDVQFDSDVFLLDLDAQRAALSDNPVCVNCHASLDPLASHLYGFYWYNYTSSQEALQYHPGREQSWSALSGVAPAYFGTPTTGLSELGEMLAADPRLVSCAVRQSWTLLVQREPELADQESLDAVREAFLDSGLSLRALFRAVLDQPAWRAGTGASERPAHLASVELLAAQVEAFTGFHWVYRDEDMMRSDRYGLHLIGGGVDGISQVRPLDEPGVGLALVQKALAEAASAYALAEEAAQQPSERRLFTELDFTETPDTDLAAMKRQLQVLHLRLFGQRVALDGDEVAEGVALWEAIYAIEGDGVAAWQGVLSALLRDPDMVLY